MPRHPEKIKFVMVVPDSQESVDSDSLAVATAADLRNDTVFAWVARVEEAIEESRRLTMPAVDQIDRKSERAIKKQSIEAEIHNLMPALPSCFRIQSDPVAPGQKG